MIFLSDDHNGSYFAYASTWLVCVCEAALSSESRDFSEMKVPVSAFFVLATPLLCTIDRLLDTSVLFSQVSVAKVGFFFYNSF